MRQGLGVGGGTSTSDSVPQEADQPLLYYRTATARTNRNVSGGRSGVASGDMAVECTGVRPPLEGNCMLPKIFFLFLFSCPTFFSRPTFVFSALTRTAIAGNTSRTLQLPGVGVQVSLYSYENRANVENERTA